MRKNRVPDNFWKVDGDLPKVGSEIEATKAEEPSFYKRATDAIMLAIRDTNLPLDCRPLYSIDKIHFTITNTSNWWKKIGVIVVEKGDGSPYMVGWLNRQLHPASHLVTHISEMLEWRLNSMKDVAGDEEPESKCDDRPQGVIFAELSGIVNRLLEETDANLYCSSVHSGKWLFEISTREEPPQKIGDLIIEPFNPPHKDEETGDVYTHMYKWAKSGESACTTDLEASLKQSFEKRWKRFLYGQEKRS